MVLLATLDRVFFLDIFEEQVASIWHNRCYSTAIQLHQADFNVYQFPAAGVPSLDYHLHFLCSF